MRRLCLLLLFAIPLSAARAEAITVRDIIELTRAGVGDDVLLALIEVDRGVFAVDTETLTTLKKAGVSERVIVAMVRSGRALAVAEQTAPADVPDKSLDPPAPHVVVIDHHEAPQVREVVVPIPIYVPFVPRARHRGAVSVSRAEFRPFAIGAAFPAVPAPPLEPREPVYWGFGGQLRPDAWRPK